MKNTALGLSLLFCAALVQAQAPIDDSDFTGERISASALRSIEREALLRQNTLVFPLKSAAKTTWTNNTPDSISGTFQLLDRLGAAFPARLAKAKLLGPGAAQAWTELDELGRFHLPAAQNAPAGAQFKVVFTLDNRYWSFRNPNTNAGYQWESPSFTAPGDIGVLRPDPASENGKLGILHLTYLQAKDFLEKNADTQWWKKPLRVNWPGSSDFFSPWGWSLDLTNALAWDIVLHELGHAVMHGAMQSPNAGGQHKIDECYSPKLAWSEGWATFFAAAVALSPADPDARFEFLVPRRAPVRIEKVPEDVCRGQGSEWRVAAGLWDLYDTHPDGGDDYSLSFAQIWRPLKGQYAESIGSAWTLVGKTLNPGQSKAAESSLIENTLLAPRPPLLAAPLEIPADWREALPR